MSYNYQPSTKTLRDTPGYTNYVVGVNKNLSGAISSAELKRYYSNIDAEVYFNGEWVEDIGNINWSIQQQTLPLYGYNSYIFDDVAQGNRIISGMFTIAFTGPNKVEEAIKKSGTASSPDATGTTYEDEEEYLNNNTASIQTTRTFIKMPVHYNVWAEKFDIDIVCGEQEQIGGNPVHIILKDCYLTTSPRQMRTKDGNPVEDVYNFIARDFVYIK